MSDYKGIFLRSYIGQDTGVAGASWNASPDIIVSGTNVSEDPQSIIASYNTNPPNNKLVLNKVNYIYVRGKKTAYTGSKARIWLYYVENASALFTLQWRGEEIKVAGENRNYIDVDTSGAGDIIMNEIPFVWSPPQLSTRNPADYYCLIAMVENNPGDPADWRRPDDFKNGKFFASLDDLGSKILANHNVAWRNTTTVQPTTVPTWEMVYAIQMPIGSAFIGVQCKDMPNDAYVEFQVAGNTAASTIIIPKMQIVVPNLRVGNVVNIPAEIKTSITVTYYQGATNPPKGANISPVLLPLDLL